MYMKTSKYPDPQIIERNVIKIVGKQAQMSLAQDGTQNLWKSFGPLKKEISHVEDSGNYSIQVYNEDFLTTTFLPTTQFTKWAGVAVADFNDIPEGLETLIIPEGLWAVFLYEGSIKDFGIFVNYVMSLWLPTSGYALDSRPQFEYLEHSSKNFKESDLSKEEFWLPIKAN